MRLLDEERKSKPQKLQIEEVGKLGRLGHLGIGGRDLTPSFVAESRGTLSTRPPHSLPAYNASLTDTIIFHAVNFEAHPPAIQHG